MYSLDGTLQRWGSLKLNDLSLCPHLKGGWNSNNFLNFAFRYDIIECSLSLEDIIDLAKISGNNNFMNLFLKFNRNNDNDNIFLKTVPILIEDLTPENRVST